MYDALGRRIETVDVIAGTTTRYYYDDQRVAVQTAVVGAAETDQRYFVFGGYIDEVLVMHDGTGDLYYAHDHLYSPVALFAANGSVVERYEYDAYGQVTIWNAAFTTTYTTSQHGNPYTFTGRELDTLDAGSRTLMYYRARTYDPETGRFMQRDPLGVNPDEMLSGFVPNFQYADGANMYQYVRSNSMKHTDPFGLHGPGWFPPWGIGLPDGSHLLLPPYKLVPGWTIISVRTYYTDFSWMRDHYRPMCTKETLGTTYEEYGLFETTRTTRTRRYTFILRRTVTDWHYGVADVYLMTCECLSGYRSPQWVSRKQNYKSSEMLYKRVETREQLDIVKKWPSDPSGPIASL